jgi:hypothetical protein
MKLLALLLVLTALGLFGSAFFGIYTAPGLEDLPTAQSLGFKNNEAKAKTDAEAAKKKGGSGGSGIFPVNTDGATAKRKAYLKENQGKVETGR